LIQYPTLGAWITDVLTGRKQPVSVNGALSGLGEVLRGIPQGSVLGPLLYILFVSYISWGVHG